MVLGTIIRRIGEAELVEEWKEMPEIGVEGRIM